MILLLLTMKLSTKLYQDFEKKTYFVRISLRGLKEKPKTPHCYLKQKMHKEGNSWRPLISSINYHTLKAQLPKVATTNFNQLLQEILSYEQNTTDFLRKINQINFMLYSSYLQMKIQIPHYQHSFTYTRELYKKHISYGQATR